MTRLLISSALMTVLAAGSAAAYQTTPPPAKPPAQNPPTTPPQTTTPPPLMQPKPAVPFPAEAKVAFVNLQSVVADSKLGKAGSAQMKQLADQMNSELTSAQNKI